MLAINGEGFLCCNLLVLGMIAGALSKCKSLATNPSLYKRVIEKHLLFLSLRLLEIFP